MKFTILTNAGKRNNSALRHVFLVYISKLSVADAKEEYEDTYCNCTTKAGSVPWCGKWSSKINESYCVLNGGLQAKHCPGARLLKSDDYISSHPSVCNKSERKL